MTDVNTEPESRSPQPIAVAVGLAWFGFFVFAFFHWGPTFSLKTQDGSIEVSRTDLAGDFGLVLADQLADRLLAASDAGPKLGRPPEGWQFFQWNLVALAAFVIIGATALGRLLLRFVGTHSGPRLETNVFGFGLGLSFVSLATLATGLAGSMTGRDVRWLLIASLALELLCTIVVARRRRGEPKDDNEADPIPLPLKSAVLVLILVAPIGLMMLLGAMSPPTDFDVREYHLQAPKEHFQNGQIEFLPHNAYTSFPFLTEMLSLLGMMLTGDWYTGALVGKIILASFAPMTALALIAAGRRCFEPRAGWLAAAIFLTTPWTYRISIIAYAEGGLTFFLFASLLATARLLRDRQVGSAALIGFMAGSAMACKYPALVSVVVPCAVTISWRCLRKSPKDDPLAPPKPPLRLALTVFAVGVAVTAGPWLLKNLVETRNPVYPLAYSVFGGEDWTPEIQARWKEAHGPPNHDIADLLSRAADVSIRSDWLSPLLFALAPLAILIPLKRRTTVAFWLYVLWMFGTWWVLTHRIDRFWVPMIPVVSLLAGAGLSSFRPAAIRIPMLVCAAALMCYSTNFCGSNWAGYNAWLTEATAAREAIETRLAGLIRTAEQLNQQSDSPGRILVVGEAAVFEARTDVIYNTVFDLNLFQEICADKVTGGPDTDATLRPTADVRARLAERDVRFIAVNWLEILRYRARGSYGFSDFVRPQTFEQLVQSGILKQVRITEGRWSALNDHDKQQVRAWGSRSGEAFVAQAIYEVVGQP